MSDRQTYRIVVMPVENELSGPIVGEAFAFIDADQAMRLAEFVTDAAEVIERAGEEWLPAMVVPIGR